MIGLIPYKLDDRHYKSRLDLLTLFFFTVRKSSDISVYVDILMNIFALINPYPTAFPYGNGMVLHFYQQQESSTTKTVHKVINKGLKAYV